MRTKLFKLLLICVLSTFILSACGSKEDDKKGSSDTTTTPVASNTGKDDTPITEPGDSDPTPTQLGDQPIDLGDLDSETLKVYPKDKSTSMFFYGAKELTDEVFFPDQEEISGDPYVFNGTILEEYDSITDYLPLNTNHGNEVKNFDVSSKAFKIMTKLGPVLVIDVVPYNSKFIKDICNSDVYQLKVNKAVYNELTNYKELPETGDTGRFYGFYYGYSSADECPVFTYGVSNLAHAGFWDYDYVKYRTDDTKKAKFRNLFTYQYPAGWSDTIDDGGRMIVLLPNNRGSISIVDWDAEDMSLEDVVKEFTGESQMMFPEDMEGDEGDMPAFNIDDFLKIHNKEKTMIGNDISAYIVELSYNYGNGVWYDEVVCAFKSKRSVCIVEIALVDIDADGNVSSSSINLFGNEEDEDISADDEEKTYGQQLSAIFKEEIKKMIDSIELCGI